MSEAIEDARRREALESLRKIPLFMQVSDEVLAELHGVPVEQVARTTTENARRFYRLPDDANSDANDGAS